MRYWLHDECGHAQAYSNSYHNGEKRNPHLTASLLEVALEPAGLSPFDAKGPAPQAGAEIWEPVLMTPAPERTSILNVIVPADGTRAAIVRKRRLRYFADFWAALGQAAASPCSTGGVSDLKRNKG
jgi:hypothetical protein